MRKALILGTGAAQVDAIRYLRNAGWWVIGCSYLREGPGLSLVHEFRQINITDVPALEELARDEGVELIYWSVPTSPCRRSRGSPRPSDCAASSRPRWPT